MNEKFPQQDDFYVKVKNLEVLFQFIKTNKYEEFIEYISSLTSDEVDVNLKDEQGNYLIFLAIMINNRRIVKKLIEFGSRLDILDTEGYSVLYYPIKFNYQEMIDLLLENDKKILGFSLVNIKDSNESVPIFYAIKYHNQYALQALLVNNADANYRNSSGVNALHLSVFYRDITMVRLIIKYIKNLDVKTNKGSTALHIASNFQLNNIVKILLDAGANPNIIEEGYDFLPIFYSVVQNDMNILKLLVHAGTDPNHQDYMGNTILHYVILLNHLEMFDYLINYYKIDKRGSDNYTENINDTILSDLIDPNLVNIDGLTFVHVMLYHYRTDFDAYLKKVLTYCNLNYQDNMGNTILHLLIETDSWKKFEKILLHKKLNAFIKNHQSTIPYHIVKNQEKDKFLQLLIESYENYLKKYPNSWLLEWQNECSSGKNMDCHHLIHNSIVENHVSVPEKKDKKSIIIEQDKVINFSTFTGSILDVICGFKYLVKKYAHTVTLWTLDMSISQDLESYYQSLGIQTNIHQHLIQFEIKWIYQKLFFPLSFDEIMTSLIQNTKNEYIIIPIAIILSNGNHSNCLLYKIKDRILERFEPHGSNYPTHFNYNPELLDEILYKKFTSLLMGIHPNNFRLIYIKPKQYLPKIGFQTFENTEININKNIGDPNGFCSLWSIWYLDYRLKYIDIKPRSLVKKLINSIRLNGYSFRNIIRNYSSKITLLRDRYLEKINKNINDYLNNRLQPPELKNLLVEILSD
jgi:ankyrin repeat protein